MNPLENKLNAMNQNELQTALKRNIMNSVTDRPSLDALSQIYNTPMEPPFLESNNLDTQINLLGENQNIVTNQINKIKEEVLSNGNIKNVIMMKYQTNNKDLDDELKKGMEILENQLSNNGFVDIDNSNNNSNNSNNNSVVPSPSIEESQEDVNNIQLLINKANDEIKKNMRKINEKSINLNQDILTNFNNVVNNNFNNDNNTLIASFKDVMNRGKMNKIFIVLFLVLVGIGMFYGMKGKKVIRAKK